MNSEALAISNPYLSAFMLGGVAGLRSLLPLGLLAVRRRGQTADRARPYGAVLAEPFRSVLVSRPATIGLPLAALAELVADKLPFVPSRLKPAVFASRVVIGALVGGAIGSRESGSPWTSAILGAVAASGAALAGNLGRATLSQVTPVPQQAWGVVEDILAVGLGWAAVSRLRTREDAQDWSA